MSAEAMKRASQPFFTTKTALPLAGMGLAATNGFARGSAGAMALHSPASGGLTVALRLPLPPAAD
jgi:C4-dicarboxylate-specific signal transduction histidine kinase